MVVDMKKQTLAPGFAAVGQDGDDTEAISDELRIKDQVKEQVVPEMEAIPGNLRVKVKEQSASATMPVGGHGNMETLLRANVRENPYIYDCHVKYIECLKTLGNIEKLRAAREEMYKYFSLTVDMWQEWINDELRETTCDNEFVESLYVRGVKEHMSIDFWLDYISFVKEHEPPSQELQLKVRKLFEQAITAGCLHISEGGKLWEAFRQHEMDVFSTMLDDIEGKREQFEFISNLFQRQFRHPYSNMDKTLEEYESWKGKHADYPSSQFDAWSYEEANKIYKERKMFENELTNDNINVVYAAFMEYIKFEKENNSPPRVHALYERAVSKFPSSMKLWRDFASFVIEKKLKFSWDSVFQRAVRNCAWDYMLWIQYMKMLERTSASEQQLCQVYEQATKFAFVRNPKEYLDIYMTRVDGLRRRLNNTANELDFTMIRQTFVDASEKLSHQLEINEILYMNKYWADLEIDVANNLPAARKIWEKCLKDNGSILDVWKHYINMEVDKGDKNEARSLYKRCCGQLAGTALKEIYDKWKEFEGKYGDLPRYLYAREMSQLAFGTKNRRLQSRVPLDHLFDLFIPEDDLKYCIRFDKVLRNSGIKYYAVPGSEYLEGMYAVGTKVSLVASLGLVQWILLLHDAGWMMDGNISIADFYVCRITGHLKLCRRKMKDLKELDKQGESQRPDTCAVAVIIRVKIFKSGPIPFDMLHMLNLLENYDSRYKIVILNHPAFKDEIGKLSEFGSLYQRLQQLYSLDRNKFDRICAAIPFSQLGRDNWKLKARKNEFLVGILKYEDPRQLAHKLALAEKKLDAVNKLNTIDSQRIAALQVIFDSRAEDLKAQENDDAAALKIEAELHLQRIKVITKKFDDLKNEALLDLERIKAQEAQKDRDALEITRSDAVKVLAAIERYPDLSLLTNPTIMNIVKEAVNNAEINAPISNEEANETFLISNEEASETFFKVILDSLGFKHFSHEGNGLLKCVRHSTQHILPGYSIEAATQDKFGYMEQSQQKFSYSELEHIFGSTFHAIFSEFVMAMAMEDELAKSVSIAISLIELIQETTEEGDTEEGEEEEESH